MIPHGPRDIGAKRQIALPVELLDRVGLSIGDSVYVAEADDPQGALLILPEQMVEGWIAAGRAPSTRRVSRQPVPANPRRSSRDS